MNENDCFDYAETSLHMLEFIKKNGESFAFNYAYLFSWEQVDYKTLNISFSGETIYINGKNLKQVTKLLSKNTLLFLKELESSSDSDFNDNEPVVFNIERSQPVAEL